MTEIALRAWQAEFIERLRAREQETDDILLIACPAAGKTIAAIAGAAELLRSREADQLIAVAPTVVVRDQWRDELERQGYRMRVTTPRGGNWPDYVHGVCTTYATVAFRWERFAAALKRRRTVVVFDEIHHVAEHQSWGEGVEVFDDAVARLLLSGTPFRTDGVTIPFVNYDEKGNAVGDYSYGYKQAVADGVCRPVEFRAHDGHVVWRGKDEEVQAASFSQTIEPTEYSRRLRAALDPTKGYMRSMLAEAQASLAAIRKDVPDAAGLVVCEDQPHAVAVDELLAEVSGEPPVLAISDMPRAHKVIEAFTDELDPWLVSVRMVAEGVDIPRLAVIVWATATSTELMVRQVAGRALRVRADLTAPAVVHMPADPRLLAHAGSLDRLAGSTARREWREYERKLGPRKSMLGIRKAKTVDPAPFLEWFTEVEDQVGLQGALHRCGFEGGRKDKGYERGARMIRRWRHEGAWANALDLFDMCHMASISFDDLYAAPEYEEIREWVHDPAIEAIVRDYRCLEAELANSRTVAPELPKPRAQAAGERFTVRTPQLPPSPDDVRRQEDLRGQKHRNALKLLAMYAELRRARDPVFSVAGAHMELAADGLRLDPDDDEAVRFATEWLRDKLSAYARLEPELLKEIAARQRRSRIAVSRDRVGSLA